MDFLFGKKYPIYDSKGQMSHRWEEFMSRWKERYRKDEALNWKNHSGKSFSKEKTASK